MGGLKVSLSSVVRFVVLFVLVDLFHFPSDNDQHPEDAFDLILEKSPLEKHCLWGNFCRGEVLMFISCDLRHAQ